MAYHLKLFADTVAAVHIAGHPRDVQSLAAIVTFDQGNHLWRSRGVVHEPAHP